MDILHNSEILVGDKGSNYAPIGHLGPSPGLMVQFHSMSSQIHGHDVMHMMVESQKTFTRETLKEAIFEKFGKETRFYTCSREGMTADELIDFLSAKGKFLETDNGFRTDPDKICNH